MLCWHNVIFASARQNVAQSRLESEDSRSRTLRASTCYAPTKNTLLAVEPPYRTVHGQGATAKRRAYKTTRRHQSILGRDRASMEQNVPRKPCINTQRLR